MTGPVDDRLAEIVKQYAAAKGISESQAREEVERALVEIAKAAREVTLLIFESDEDEIRAAERLRAALARLDSEAREQLDGVTRRPTEAGGPGKEEAYWMRQKLQASIGHLRDIEDYFRVEVGGEPGSYNMARADRARSLYEQMSEDFIHGRLGTPTMRERAEAAEAEVQRLTGERDIWRARYLSTWERMQRIEEVARHAIRQGFLHQHEWVKVLNEADRALLADSPPYTTQARTIDPLSALRPDGGGA